MVTLSTAEGPERTPDGRYVVVGGRRWRASDPHIPDPLRQELVEELMAARRAVRAKEPDARRRVQDAKVALGERGPQWWEPLTPGDAATRIESATRALLRKRDGASICPSEVARIVDGADWRALMDAVRDAAIKMAGSGELEFAQRGRRVSPPFTGPIRIVRGPGFDGVPAAEG